MLTGLLVRSTQAGSHTVATAMEAKLAERLRGELALVVKSVQAELVQVRLCHIASKRTHLNFSDVNSNLAVAPIESKYPSVHKSVTL